VAYRRAHGFALTLGPPLCARSDRADLIQRFLALHRRPLFFYVPRDVASQVTALGGRRFHACGMGIDKVLPLDGALEAPGRRVEGALRKAARAGFSVEEVSPGALPQRDRGRVSSITAGFLSRSAVPVEMQFLNRPMSWVDDGLARTFLLRQGAQGRVFGYAALDPYFSGGQVAGYLLNLLRCEPTRLWGVYYATVATLAARLRAEGVRQLSLGLCPLTNVETEARSSTLGAQVRWMERRFSAVAYLARLRELKDAFGGHTAQRWFVTPSRWAPATLLAVVRACGVPLSGMLGPQLLHALLPWLRGSALE
jgi:lysylphosphatidylglycerol synthetase-like protein (DUF2156 family)